ncbi:TPA: flippase [Morganella morganii]
MKNSLIKNILSLFSIQTLNYFLPLLFIPYLVKTLGIENFGVYTLALAGIQYLIIITDYGFNYTITREISINRGNKEKIDILFSSTILCKCILAIISIIIIVIFNSFFSHSAVIREALYFGIPLIIGNVLFPIWLFQGYEKMVFLAISNFIARIICVPLIFIFIDNKNDIYLAIFIQGLTSILASIVSLLIVYKYKLVSIRRCTISDIKNNLKSGWDIFVSTSFVSLYINSIPIILGSTSGNESVGIYAAADKIRQAIQGLIGPVSQALYPRLSNLMITSQKDAVSLIRKVIILFVLPLSLICTCIFMLSSDLVRVLYDNTFSESITVLKILIFIPPIIALGNVIGVQLMLPLGLFKEFSRTYVISGIIGFPLLYILSLEYSYIGVAISSVATETIVLIIFTYFLYKKIIFKRLL